MKTDWFFQLSARVCVCEQVCECVSYSTCIAAPLGFQPSVQLIKAVLESSQQHKGKIGSERFKYICMIFLLCPTVYDTEGFWLILGWYRPPILFGEKYFYEFDSQWQIGFVTKRWVQMISQGKWHTYTKLFTIWHLPKFCINFTLNFLQISA